MKVIYIYIYIYVYKRLHLNRDLNLRVDPSINHIERSSIGYTLVVCPKQIYIYMYIDHDTYIFYIFVILSFFLSPYLL